MEFVSDWAQRAITTYILPSLNDSSQLSAIASQVTSYLAEITENSGNLNSETYNPESTYSYSYLRSSSQPAQSAKMPFDPIAYLTQFFFFFNNNNDNNINMNNNHLTSFIPTDIQSLLPTLVSPLPPPLRAIILTTVSTTIWLTTYTTSLLTALLSSSNPLTAIFSSSSSSSSTTTTTTTLVLLLLTSLLTLYLTLRVLAFVRRLISYTVRLAVRLTFWAGLAALAAWCYGRGVEKTIGDVAGIAAFWWEEWGRFSAQQDTAANAAAAAAAAANGQSGYEGQDRARNRYDGYYSGGGGGGGGGYGYEGFRVR